MATNIQIGNEKARAVYGQCPRPLLAQLCELHDISIREFAAIFGVSKSYAEEIVNHKKFPPLDVAFRIARYWECSVEELFGWRVDDDGIRRPLIAKAPQTGKFIRLDPRLNKDHQALNLVTVMVENLKTGVNMFALPKKKRG